MALLAEQELEEITVTDICERAMVHRTTFYKHYEDKYDLLLKGMREIYDALAAEADLSQDAFSLNQPAPVFIGFFEHVEKHQRFYRLMLCGDGIGKFQGLLRAYLAELCLVKLQKAVRSPAEPAIPLPILAQFCAGTAISTVIWWLENDQPYSSEQMASYVQKLLQSGCTLKELA